MKKKTEKKRDGVKLTRKAQQNARRNTTRCGRKGMRRKGFCRQQKKCTRSNCMKKPHTNRIIKRKKNSSKFQTEACNR